MSDWMYLKVEKDDMELCHTFHPEYRHGLSVRKKPLTKEDFDRQVATFIKKAHALFEFTDVLKEVEGE